MLSNIFLVQKTGSVCALSLQRGTALRFFSFYLSWKMVLWVGIRTSMKWIFPLNWLRASVDDIMSRHRGYEKKCCSFKNACGKLISWPQAEKLRHAATITLHGRSFLFKHIFSHSIHMERQSHIFSSENTIIFMLQLQKCMW